MANNLFSYFEMLGLNDSILFQSIDEFGSVKDFSLTHVEYDGVSGLIHLLKQNHSNMKDMEISSLRSEDESNKTFFKKIKLMMLYFLNDIAPKKRNTHRCSNFKSNEFVRFYHFEKEELDQLVEKSKKQGVNLNTLILNKVNKFITPYTLNNNLGNFWMIPVSLYQNISLENDKGCNSSFIDLEILPKETLSDIHSNLKIKVSNFEFWAPKIIEKFIIKLPDFIALRLVKSHFEKVQRMGCFSNLGRWIVPDLNHNIKWGFSAPLSNNQPFTCSLVTINDNLCISLRAYEYLDLKPLDLDLFKSYILEK